MPAVTETTPDRRPAPSVWAAAAVAIAIAAALAAWGTFGAADDEGNNDFNDYWPVLVIIGVLAAIVFGWAVPSALRNPGRAAKTALVLSVLGLLSIIAFWSGAPPILAIGGILLGYLVREGRLAGGEASRRGFGTAAIVIGVLALVADVVVYISDQT